MVVDFRLSLGTLRLNPAITLSGFIFLPSTMSEPLSSPVSQTAAQAIALTHLEAGHYAQACQGFETIPDSDRTPDDWVNHAVCLIHLDQPEAALEICDRALALYPNHPQTWLFKGVALQRLNRYDDAYACYDKAAGAPKDRSLPANKPAWYRRLSALGGVAKHILHAN